jgi:hypothetical protein
MVFLGKLLNVLPCPDEVLQVERNSTFIEGTRVALLRGPFADLAIAVLEEIR